MQKILYVILFFAVVFILIYVFGQDYLPLQIRYGTEQQTVRGESMEPALKDGQTISIDNKYYQTHEIERNDIVTVVFSWREEPIVKFIRAVPGDTIILEEQEDGNFYIIINGKSILNSEEEPYSLTYAKSRMINLYAKEYKEKYNSKIPDNLYLVLGNQTSGTQDSTQFGLVERENIVGKVIGE